MSNNIDISAALHPFRTERVDKIALQGGNICELLSPNRLGNFAGPGRRCPPVCR